MHTCGRKVWGAMAMQRMTGWLLLTRLLHGALHGAADQMSEEVALLPAPPLPCSFPLLAARPAAADQGASSQWRNICAGHPHGPHGPHGAPPALPRSSLPALLLQLEARAQAVQSCAATLTAAHLACCAHSLVCPTTARVADAGRICIFWDEARLLQRVEQVRLRAHKRA